MADSDEDWIKKRAYELWEAEGYPTGKDSEHWEQAKLEYATAKPVKSASSPRRKDSGSIKAPLAAEPSPATKSPSKPASKTGAKPDTKSVKVASSKTNSSKTPEPSASPDQAGAKKASKKVSAGK